MVELERYWEEPPKKYRPLQIVHFYFPKTESEMLAYLRQAEELALGGFVVNVDWTDADTYLRDEAEWERLKLFVSLALEHGFNIWLYDEKLFPSGSAGKWVYEGNPEYQVQGVICQRADVGEQYRGEMELAEGKLLSVAAYRVIDGKISLDSKTDLSMSVEGSKVRWDLPEGQWAVLAFLVQKLDWETRAGTPYVDLLNPAAMRKFIDVTYQSYLDHLGPDIMSKIEAIFTDEPSLPVHGCDSIFRVDYPVIPWTDGLDRRFEREYGYDIVPCLPKIFFETCEEYRKTRRDLWSLISRMVQESFFKQIADWCEENGTRFTGHLYGEETLSMQVGLEGDLFGALRYMQLPGVDRLYCTNPQDLIPEKTASSVAHLLGRERVMSESSEHFERTLWNKPVDVTDMINSCTYQYALGLNVIASYFPLGVVSPEDRARFQMYMGRLAVALAGGKHVAPVLVHHPIGGAWERYQAPPRKYWQVGPGYASLTQPEPMRRLEIQFGETLSHLMDSQWDFDLIDDQGLAGCKVVDGQLDTGYEQFKALVLFGSSRPDDPALQTALGFAAAGGTVIVMKSDETEPLSWIDDLKEAGAVVVDVPDLSDTLAGSIDRDVTLSIPDAHIWCLHRPHASHDVYMIYNRDEQAKDLEVTLSAKGNVQLRDPMTGEVRDLGRTNPVAFTAPAKSAVFLVVTPLDRDMV